MLLLYCGAHSTANAKLFQANVTTAIITPYLPRSKKLGRKVFLVMKTRLKATSPYAAIEPAADVEVKLRNATCEGNWVHNRRPATAVTKMAALCGCLLFETLHSASLNGKTESRAIAKTSLETAIMEIDVLRMAPIIEIIVATMCACGPRARAYILTNG